MDGDATRHPRKQGVLPVIPANQARLCFFSSLFTVPRLWLSATAATIPIPPDAPPPSPRGAHPGEIREKEDALCALGTGPR